MKVAAIIQARMGSERLPGKVLKQIHGQPMVWHIVQRLKRALTVGEIVVATTINPQDDQLVWECRKMGITVFRGSEEDVLERYFLAAQVVNSDKICRITGDNPLIEPGFIDMAAARMEYSEEDYICVEGCPLGTGIELFTQEVLSIAAQEADQPYQREHVTPYIWENPTRFKIGSIKVPLHLYYPDLRLTVDTEEDFVLAEKIYDFLYQQDTALNLHQVIDLLVAEPEWCQLNSHVQQRAIK